MIQLIYRKSCRQPEPEPNHILLLWACAGNECHSRNESNQGPLVPRDRSSSRGVGLLVTRTTSFLHGSRAPKPRFPACSFPRIARPRDLEIRPRSMGEEVSCHIEMRMSPRAKTTDRGNGKYPVDGTFLLPTVYVR